MVFLTIYYMSWGLSYFYENLQLEIRKGNTIYAMHASNGRLISTTGYRTSALCPLVSGLICIALC